MGALSVVAWLGVLLNGLPVDAAGYFVSLQGSDTNDGVCRGTAFATIQRGVDALAPGDTLTILPGEYRGAVRRDGLGGTGAVTTIRAEIPGTAVLRGDVAVTGFRAADGQPDVYTASCGITGEVAAVNEVDTLQVLERVPNLAELRFRAGVFHHDAAAGTLSLTTPDGKPAMAHRYTAAVTPTHGLYLRNPRRVVVEGLAVTGFNAAREQPYGDMTLSSTWGLMLVSGKDCVIRDCRAWLNGQGIGLNSEDERGGDNVIERCAAWGNKTQFGVGDRGGLTLISPRRDTIRDSTAFFNGEYGINIRRGGPPDLAEGKKSLLVDNVAWGNLCDFKIKTGYAHLNEIERCAGDVWTLNGGAHALWSLVGRGGIAWERDTIMLGAETNLSADAEFADPLNHDYRLQGTSRFRGSGPEGRDRGAYAYETNVFFVGPTGDDAADGQSVSHAWKTPGRATKALRPGDTLCLEPGVYAGDLDLALQGKEGAPVSLRGRGREPVVIQGALRISDSRHVEFTRLHFIGPVTLSGSTPHPATPDSRPSLLFENCQFAPAPGTAVAMTATGVPGLRVSHCEFTGFQEAAIALSGCAGVQLSGNLYDNRTGVGVRTDDTATVLYADYNGYRVLDRAWQGGKDGTASAKSPERYAREIVPEYEAQKGILALRNGIVCAGLGPLGRPIGLYRDDAPRRGLRMVEAPRVHRVSATTANVEWRTSLPATCALGWGETTDCTNRVTFDVNYFGTYSLTGLEPGRRYYFRVTALKVPEALAERLEAEPAEVAGAPLSFATLAQDEAPAAYYVAPDGSDTNTGLARSNAWRTIQRAADGVRPGDTVRIAAGRYAERVRIRTTGATGKPITFTGLPGEKVVMHGAGKALNAFFVAAGKSHLRFDGFYFVDSNREGLQGWPLELSGEFHLYRCRDVAITRCFSDGRGGYSARSVTAWQVEALTIQNCVTMNKMMGAWMLDHCPDLRVQHCVIVRPMMSGFDLRNEPWEKSTFANNIFTDMLKKKAELNHPLFYTPPTDGIRMPDNCIFVRCFPPEQRALLASGASYAEQRVKHPKLEAAVIINPLFADPAFAAAVKLVKGGETPHEYSPDRLMDAGLPLDFDSFFATNPEVVKRGMGLQPEAFKDFAFDRKDSSK